MIADLTFNEVMGLVCLGVLWVNVLLIAAAALIDLRRLWRRFRRMTPWVQGRVVEGWGSDGTLARFVVHQRGRARGDGPIVFNDIGYASTCEGGTVELVGGERIEIDSTWLSEDGGVWVGANALRAAAACPGDEVLARQRRQANKAQGWLRDVGVVIGVGDRVWLPRGAGARWVSKIHPGRWLLGRAAVVVGFIAGSLALTVGITLAALWPPVFGLVSTLGAAAGLGFFLGVQPVGVMVRDLCRPPHRAHLRGQWGRARGGRAPQAAGAGELVS